MQHICQIETLALWHILVTKVVKLKTNHRFDNDKEFDELLDRYRVDTWTEDDVKTINCHDCTM